MISINGAYVDGVSVTHGTPQTTYGHLQLDYQRVIPPHLRSVHVMPVFTYVSHHLWEEIISVSRESMSVGLVEIDITECTPVIYYGMQRTVSPAAHVAHDVILHILSSNCRPQPLTTLRPGSVCLAHRMLQT